MTPVDSQLDLFSLGAIASQAQRSVRAIEQAAAVLGIAPALRINGVVHFDAGQVELILARLNRPRGEQ